MIYDIKIPNFEMYNPRSDRKRHSWFRLQNDWHNDPKLYGCCPITRYVYACILGQLQSNGQSGAVQIESEWLSDYIKVDHEKMVQSLLKLHERQALIVSGNQSVSSGCPTNERTNERTSLSNRSKLDQSDPGPKSPKRWTPSEKQLLECYALYPKKQKRAKFLERVKKSKPFKTEKDLQNFKKAIERYQKHLVENHKEEYTMLITTFLGDWRDWLDDETGQNKLRVVDDKPENFKWDQLADDGF